MQDFPDRLMTTLTAGATADAPLERKPRPPTFLHSSPLRSIYLTSLN